jgi:hypothetical protein
LKTVIDLELESILCLRIAPEKVKFYQETKGFGENVANRFPSAAFDIEEAGKCYACNRNTACVMHLARAVEVGLKSVMASLGLSVPTGRQPSWGEVLRDIWTEIGNRNKAADPAWTGQQKAFLKTSTQTYLPLKTLGATLRCTRIRFMILNAPRTFTTQ